MRKNKLLIIILLTGLMSLTLPVQIFSHHHFYLKNNRKIPDALIWQQASRLPGIDLLKKLRLELLLDLSQRNDVALPWVGKIGTNDDFVFFDAKLKRLMAISLNGQNLKTIGSFGEGPGEYQIVRDILLSEGRIIILETRNYIIEYDFQKNLLQVVKIPFTGLKLLGYSGGTYYLVARSVTEQGILENEVVSWQEGKKPQKLFKRPLSVIRTRAVSADGQEMAGGGLLTLSEPAFAFLGDKLAVASGSQYVITFFDLEGREKTTWKLEAPEPEYASKEFSSFKKIAAPYAIRDIFPLPDGLAIISNYFRDGQPRLDCFGLDGKLRSSWLIPIRFDPLNAQLWLDHRYLVYFSAEEGCRVYRISFRL